MDQDFIGYRKQYSATGQGNTFQVSDFARMRQSNGSSASDTELHFQDSAKYLKLFLSYRLKERFDRFGIRIIVESHKFRDLMCTLNLHTAENIIYKRAV